MTGEESRYVERHELLIECEKMRSELHRLKMRDEELERTTESMHRRMESMGSTLSLLVNQINQVRWMVIGALIALVAENIGLVETLKAIIVK